MDKVREIKISSIKGVLSKALWQKEPWNINIMAESIMEAIEDVDNLEFEKWLVMQDAYRYAEVE